MPKKKAPKKIALVAPRPTRLREFDSSKGENIRVALANSVPEEWALKWTDVKPRLFKNWLRHNTEFRQAIRAARAQSATSVVSAYNTLRTRGVTEPKTALRFLQYVEHMRQAHPPAITIRDPLVPQRPTSWSLEKQALIATFVSQWIPLSTSARYAGVHPDAAYMWMEAGAKEFAKDEPTLTSYQFQFYTAIMNARDTREIRAVKQIHRKAEDGDVEQAKYLLERSPETRRTWGTKTTQVAVAVSPTAARIEVEPYVSALPEETLDGHIARFDRVLSLTEQNDGSFA